MNRCKRTEKHCVDQWNCRLAAVKRIYKVYLTAAHLLFSSYPLQQALSSPITSELLVGALPVVPMEPLASPAPSERATQPQIRTISGQDTHTVTPDQCVEASPLHSDPEDTPLICSSPHLQDAETPPPTSFSPPAGAQIVRPGPASPVPQITARQPHIDPQVQCQVPHQLQVSQALFAQNPVPIQSPLPQPMSQVQASDPQVQVQQCFSQPQSSVNTPLHSSLSPLQVSVSVPQQQPDPIAASLSKDGDDSAVQQHTQNSELQPSLLQ